MQINVDLHEDVPYFCTHAKSPLTQVCAYCTEYYFNPAYELATNVMRTNPYRLEPNDDYYITFDVSGAKYFGNHIQCCNPFCVTGQLTVIRVLGPSMFCHHPVDGTVSVRIVLK